uniref:Uncharacterized protein n=1 Tax=Anopheles coluzzii TaxID=1518534 RepID=A0A8W7PJM6_ANOCL
MELEWRRMSKSILASFSTPVVYLECLMLRNDSSRSSIVMAGVPSSKPPFCAVTPLNPFGSCDPPAAVPFACALLLAAARTALIISLFFITFRIRWTDALRHTSFRSEPEYPFVLRASCRILCRCSSFGSPMWNWAGMRRRMALSRSCGRLVAPITMIVESDSVFSPSHSIMNCVFIMAVASWSDELRARRNESISSIKMMQG